MDAKQFLTLTRLLKFDDESSKALGILLKSKFPKRYVQFIIKAKPYWVSMRVDLQFMFVKINFLLQSDKADRLDEALRPMYLVIGKARSRRLVEIEHKLWVDNTLSQKEEDYIQHDYWWRF